MMAEDTEHDAGSSNPFVRVYRRIARDQDFAKLDPDAKVIYLRLLVDPDNNSAGLFTLAVNRWARWANMSLERTCAALRELDATGFVVLDEGQEELVVRTKLRNDTLVGASSWKTQKGAIKATLKAVSPRIRVALAGEIDKCLDLLRPNVLDYADEVMRELRSDACIDAYIEASIDTNWKQTTDHRPPDHIPQTTDRQTTDASHVALGWGSGGSVRNSSDVVREPPRVLAHLTVLRDHFCGVPLTVTEVATHMHGAPSKNQITSTREGLKLAVTRGLATMTNTRPAAFSPVPTYRWQP